MQLDNLATIKKSSTYLSNIGASLLLLPLLFAAAYGCSSSNGVGDGGSQNDAGATAGSTGSAGNGSAAGNGAGAGSGSAAGKGGSAAGSGSNADDGGTGVGAPTVVSTLPLADATGIALNAPVSGTFDEPMDATTLNTSTFLVTAGNNTTPISGTVMYADGVAVFWPATQLSGNRVFHAKITTGAQAVSGGTLQNDFTWSFTTGRAAAAPGVPVNLRTAAGFAILAKSGISTVPKSAITGNIGVSPAAATYITGFSLTKHSSNVYATAPQVVGKIYAADFAAPTPSNMTTAIADMQLAFTDAASRAPSVTELGAGNIGGMTLTAGVYKWGTGLLIPTDVTLTGSATDVWIFAIAKDLTVSSAKRIHLAGGALAKNVFWQVAGKSTLGTTAHLEGTLLCKTSIALGTGASINGRLLAQTAVMIDGSTVVQPAP